MRKERPEVVRIPRRPKGRCGASVSARLRALRQHPLFSVLAPEHINRLSTYATTRTIKRGVRIFNKGGPGTSVFLVCAGMVKIGMALPDGRDAVFNLAREGQIFGEISMLDGQPRTADATAMTDCELLVIDRRDFVALVRSQPEIAFKLIEVLCAHLRRISEQMEDVLLLDLPGRLAKLLLRLTESTEASAGRRRVAMTQSEIGRMIGISRESANRQLRMWEARDWVRVERGGITVLVPAALAHIASSRGSEDAWIPEKGRIASQSTTSRRGRAA